MSEKLRLSLLYGLSSTEILLVPESRQHFRAIKFDDLALVGLA